MENLKTTTSKAVKKANSTKKVLKRREGITLIALIITVIVMLILAGVSISALMGNEGLFARTASAADAYKQASKKENNDILGLLNELDSVLGEVANKNPEGGKETEPKDTTAPTIAELASSNVGATEFTLTAKGKDETEIGKYEFYIDNELEKTETTNEETAVYEVTGKNSNTRYVCKVIVYDKAGNKRESNQIEVNTLETIVIADLAKNGTLKIGDYVDYDAGEWTQDDLDKITASTGTPKLHSTVYDETENNQTKPTEQGQFGGFELGQSRNSNSTPYNSSWANPRTSGWRIWDINKTTGEVTIIHAGHPETYYHNKGESDESINILRNRDCSMYVKEEYATKAHILMGYEVAKWYTKNCATRGKVYELESYDEDVDMDGWKGEMSLVSGESLDNFVTAEEMPAIEVLENGSYYFLASASGTDNLFIVVPDHRYVSDSVFSLAMGVRVLVYLKTDIYLEQAPEAGSVDNPWEIVKNQ